MEQQDLQKRLLLALILSFFVFIGYSYLFPTQQAGQKVEQETNVNSAHQAPKVDTAATTRTKPGSVRQAASAPVQTAVPVLVTVTSANFILTIDEYGRISQVELLEEKYKDDEGNNLKILDINEVKPLEVRFSDAKINEEAFKTPYTSSSTALDLSKGTQTVTLTQKLSTLTLPKKITNKPTGEYDNTVSSSNPVPYFITPGYRPVADRSKYMLVRGVLIKGADNIITTIEDGKAEGDESFKNAKIASAFDRYYASMFFDFDKGMNISILKEKEDNPLIFVQGDKELHLNGYIGPKDHKVLKSINPELTDAIEFGWFSFLATPFL